MKLVDDVKNAWKWFSVQAMTLASVIQIAWITLPMDMKQLIPSTIMGGMVVIILVGGIIGRLIDQPKA